MSMEPFYSTRTAITSKPFIGKDEAWIFAKNREALNRLVRSQNFPVSDLIHPFIPSGACSLPSIPGFGYAFTV
jgi:hypothetical protein